MTSHWLVLTPPIIVLIIAFITKRLNPALITGIICAALIAMDFNIIASVKLTGFGFWIKITEVDTWLIYSFLIMLGTVVSLVIKTGGAAAFTTFASKKLKTKKQAETTSLLFSLSLFIDDYLSNSTVGYVMRPLTDKFKVARAKLAFMVHSIATPLVAIAPVSGWSGMIAQRLAEAKIAPAATAAGVSILADPYLLYVKSIPFIFYSFLMLISVIFVVRKRISYGPMHHHEIIAEKTGNLTGGNKDEAPSIGDSHNKTGTLADLFVPLFTLAGTMTICTLFLGKIITNPSSFLALFIAGAITVVVSFLFSITRNKIKTTDIKKLFFDGFKLMKDPIIMLFLASILGMFIQENLLTGHFLADLLVGSINLALIPLMLFLVSAAIAIATGTSWGTIAIMMPIAIPMVIKLSQASLPAAASSIALLLPTIGAVLSGAVCGDHISPVSETTVMASSSAGSTPVVHAVTQFFYALPAVLCSCLAFLLSGYLIGHGNFISCAISFSISLVLCLAILYILGRINKKK